MAVPDVIGAAEIAVRLGLSRSRTNQIVRDGHGFPQPIARLRIGRVWLAYDVEQWIREHRR